MAFREVLRMNADYFAGRLRELREAAGLTQEQLADRAGVKRDAVARWEAGKREPGWSNILALASALGVDCRAFTDPPTTEHEPKVGRPTKPKLAQPAPQRSRGRPKKSGDG